MEKAILAKIEAGKKLLETKNVWNKESLKDFKLGRETSEETELALATFRLAQTEFLVRKREHNSLFLLECEKTQYLDRFPEVAAYDKKAFNDFKKALAIGCPLNKIESQLP